MRGVLLTYLILAQSVLIAQSRPEDISLVVMNHLKGRDSKIALDTLNNFLNPALRSVLLSSVKEELNKIDSSDKFIDWMWIPSVRVSNDLILVSSLLKYDKQPYRLDILYYRKARTWVIQDLSISSELFSELKEASKAQRIWYNNRVSIER